MRFQSHWLLSNLVEVRIHQFPVVCLFSTSEMQYYMLTAANDTKYIARYLYSLQLYNRVCLLAEATGTYPIL